MATIALAVLGGAAATGHAAKPTHSVTAVLDCEPPAVKPGRTVGCTLTVTNTGTNNVVKVVASETVDGGTFLSEDSSLCNITDTATPPTSTLTCNIGTLAAGSIFGPVSFELQVPSTEGPFALVFDGFFDPEPLKNPNRRGSDTFKSNTVTTQLDADADFDGTFANVAGDTVQTGGAISASNPYTTTGTVLGVAFAAGMSVREENAGPNNINCSSTGCFGGQVIQFNITPLDGVSFPESFTLTWQVVVPNGTKAGDIVVRHDGVVQSLCPDTDPCVSITIDPSTKIATFEAQRPGDENGGWGSS